MTDDRDAPVHDASRDDVSLLRRTPPPARARRRSAWSPEPTTEAGRRRRRRARWATALVVAGGVVFETLHLFARVPTRERPVSLADDMDTTLRNLLVVRVDAREVERVRTLVFSVCRGADAIAFSRDGPDVGRYTLPLPADEEAVERTATAIAADVRRRGRDTPLFTVAGIDRDDDRVIADLVTERVRARVGGFPAR